MTNEEVMAAANALFGSAEFLQREIPESIQLTATNVTVDDTEIPVAYEWTQADNEYVVCNQLNSCLGIVGLKEDGNIRVVHLSEDPERIMNNADGLAGLQEWFNGYNPLIFGGSKDEWQDYGGLDWIQPLESLPDDQNAQCWYFFINGGQLGWHHW